MIAISGTLRAVLTAAVSLFLLAGCASAVPGVSHSGGKGPATPDFSKSPIAPSPSSSTDGTPALTMRYAVRCSPGQLRLAWQGPVSEMTQQSTLSLTLTNVSDGGCYLFGYPGVSLVDSAGRPLALIYARTGDMEVTSAPPGHVDLTPGGTAYVALNKNVCVLGDGAVATAVRLIPPADSSPLQVSIGSKPAMDACTQQGDPGSTVHVSPVESSWTGTQSGS